MCILNVHNHNLSALDVHEVERFWNEQVLLARNHERTFKFLALGDFNIPESPPRSFRSPLQAASGPLPPTQLPVIDNRGQHMQARWRRMFSSVTEITSDLPTRYDSHRLQVSCIDRFFLAGPASQQMLLDVTLQIAHESTQLSDRGLSDHAMLMLKIKPSTPRAQLERASP
eukprot:2548859-Pyramimonas_sp.AAC.1